MALLDNKVAIITGGAGGIGSAAARLFVENGCSVMLVDRSSEALEQAVRSIGGDRIASSTADVTDPVAVAAYTQATVDQFGGLDIALLNAGITGPNTLIDDYPLETFDEVMSVNVRGVWLGLKAAIPHIKRRGSGAIVMTSSIQGLAAMPGTTGYTTSKHAVVGMMKGAALELARHNIRVNAINPGFVATPMMDRIHRSSAPDAPESVEAALSATVPLRRYARAEEIARLMLFLASSESAYCTGACYLADGGTLASFG